MNKETRSRPVAAHASGGVVIITVNSGNVSFNQCTHAAHSARA